LLVSLWDGVLGFHLFLCHFVLPPDEHNERQRRRSVPGKRKLQLAKLCNA
jgi:hypothetical protein